MSDQTETTKEELLEFMKEYEEYTSGAIKPVFVYHALRTSYGFAKELLAKKEKKESENE